MPTTQTTETLAIWGAVTGTIGGLGGLAALVNLLRDRQKVAVTCVPVDYFEDDESTCMLLEFTVVNVGRRPVTVMSAGVALETVWACRRWRRVRRSRRVEHFQEGEGPGATIASAR